MKEINEEYNSRYNSIIDELLYNFDDFSVSERNELLIEYSSYANSCETVCRILGENFKKIRSDLRIFLILKLSDFTIASNELANILKRHYNRLSPELRNLLLFKLAKNEVSKELIRTIDMHFEDISIEIISDLLTTLVNHETDSDFVASFLEKRINLIPSKKGFYLLLKLSEYEESAWIISNILESKFDDLPENIKLNLILKLSSRDSVIENIINLLYNNPDFFDENFLSIIQKNIIEILIKSTEERSMPTLAKFVTENFFILSEELRDRNLIRLSNLESWKKKCNKIDIEETEAIVFAFLKENINNVSRNVILKIFLNFSLKDKFVEDIADILENQFLSLKYDQDTYSILINLSKTKNVYKILLKILEKYYNIIPEEVRIEILLNISKYNDNSLILSRILILRHIKEILKDYECFFPTDISLSQFLKNFRNIQTRLYIQNIRNIVESIVKHLAINKLKNISRNSIAKNRLSDLIDRIWKDKLIDNKMKSYLDFIRKIGNIATHESFEIRKFTEEDGFLLLIAFTISLRELIKLE